MDNYTAKLNRMEETLDIKSHKHNSKRKAMKALAILLELLAFGLIIYLTNSEITTNLFSWEKTGSQEYKVKIGLVVGSRIYTSVGKTILVSFTL